MNVHQSGVIMKYQCIECGNKVQRLYREYKAGIIKIAHCESCQAVADKYIEYDPVIICLDALLLQRQAYRHLLLNTQFHSHWRLAMLLWVCGAFIKLVVQKAELANKLTHMEPVNYTFIGLELYLNFMIVATELLILLAMVLTFYGLKSLWLHRSLQEVSGHLITRAVIISSMWQVLVIPALLWGQVYSNVYICLSQGFVCVSTFQALRVVTQDSYNSVWAALSVGVGFTVQKLVSAYINEWITSGFLDKLDT